jgi:hypothetical protein
VSDLQELRYPVGKFVQPDPITIVDRTHALDVLAELPSLLREALRGLDFDQKNTPYREGGWTVRQVVHHVADSHMTAFHRVRRALTEDTPTVASYDEAAFARLPDVAAPEEWSLELIEALHARWVMMLQGLDEAQWQRTYVQDARPPISVEQVTLVYAWHSRHHVAHIMRLRAAQRW